MVCFESVFVYERVTPLLKVSVRFGTPGGSLSLCLSLRNVWCLTAPVNRLTGFNWFFFVSKLEFCIESTLWYVNNWIINNCNFYQAGETTSRHNETRSYSLERSDQRMERSDHGAKWPNINLSWDMYLNSMTSQSFLLHWFSSEVQTFWLIQLWKAPPWIATTNEVIKNKFPLTISELCQQTGNEN